MPYSVRYEINQDGIDEINELIGDLLDQLGLNVVGNADPPVDTGFMQASAYLKSERVDTFGGIWPDGQYFSPREGQDVDRAAASGPVYESGPFETIVGWAADYSAIVEDEQDAFIYRALVDTIQP